MRSKLAVVLSTCLLMMGCLSTVRIKRDPLALTTADQQKTDMNGIPFYIKVGQCKQVTTWLQPIYTLTLKKTATTVFVDEGAANKESEATKKPKPKLPEPVVTTAIQVLSLTSFGKPEVLQLRALLSNTGSASQSDAAKIHQEWGVIASWPAYLPFSSNEDILVASGDAIEVANSSSPDSSVDYSRAYYYNSPRPWIGTSQVDAKLASDGTLTEGSAQVESETLSTLVPIGTALSTFATIETGGAAAAATAPPGLPPPPPPPPSAYDTELKVRYELAIHEDDYKHTHTRYARFTMPCAIEPGGVTNGYALSVDMAATKEDKKDDGSTVKVSGSVVLPKSAPEKK